MNYKEQIDTLVKTYESFVKANKHSDTNLKVTHALKLKRLELLEEAEALTKKDVFDTDTVMKLIKESNDIYSILCTIYPNHAYLNSPVPYLPSCAAQSAISNSGVGRY